MSGKVRVHRPWVEGVHRHIGACGKRLRSLIKYSIFSTVTLTVTLEDCNCSQLKPSFGWFPVFLL